MTATAGSGCPDVPPRRRSIEERNDLVEKNLRLIGYCLSRLHLQGHRDADDLFQVGCLELVRMANRFDESRGIRFSTYAVKHILRRLRWYLWTRCNVSVRIPQNASLELLADLRRRFRTRSLPGQDSATKEGKHAADLVADPTAPECEQEAITARDREVIEQALKWLPKRWATVIRGRYLEGKTVKELAADLGVTRARYHQIVNDAMARLRAVAAGLAERIGG